VTQLAQITNPVVIARSLFKIENYILLHRHFLHIFYLEYKDGVDVQQLRSNVLAVDATLSQAPSAKDFPVPGRSAVACSEPRHGVGLNIEREQTSTNYNHRERKQVSGTRTNSGGYAAPRSACACASPDAEPKPVKLED